MRQLANGDRIRRFMRSIGAEAPVETQLYFTGGMHQSRRQFLSAAGLVFAGGALSHDLFGQEKKETRLILLGTKGGPRVGEGRGNSSTLLLINGTPYVVDCGYGTSRQLVNAGVPLRGERFLRTPGCK